ncbi:energy-coupling factor transport system ATP-binding protein [Thermanaeromonas toyohensis ToBE]|uniref:Energy-coupling factor transport system ATP-binding protein n=1 Tax=Thermanaeromonas toyohensis ToBE TaxID=698762 RepID=A0A1W1V6L0_9FIRM|nr:energy-coupling factor transporter ATPase [Thermanaeromonas toyohensis]SMB88953.1 energy-coupling factor transport system ATP-binding protein [Thermanaeromonas toyohensis ToBE]
MLCFRGVSFSYPGVPRPALQDVTFTLAPGEFVVVMGPNGSGKSTLTRLGNGLLLPAQGEVVVDGLNTKDPAALPRVRQRVGLVFQDPDNQMVAATVEEDVAFGPENLGLPPEEIKRRVEEALDTLGIANLRHRPPHRLSGGQKQKVALAGILAMEPQYILLDEATAMLDPRSREEVLGLLNFLCREQGIGLLLVTHLPEEALVADRVVVLYEGVIWKEGTPEEVFSQPEELVERGLEAPQTVLLAQRLARRGLKLPYKALRPEELAQALWTLAVGDISRPNTF